jgi:hypothetical protein
MNVTGVDTSGLEWTGADIFSAKKCLTVFLIFKGARNILPAAVRLGALLCANWENFVSVLKEKSAVKGSEVFVL